MQKVYFASDFHLGIDGRLTSGEREKQIVRWLEHIRGDAAAIYLVGDVFDFWFEYTTVVPKGHVRLLGKLAELRDQGIPIYFFTGNHDMWVFRYFEEELDIPTYRKPIRREIMGKQFLIGHGDGLGPGDYGYKRIKKVFANPACQWLFERLHPNFGIGLANFWSQRSRAADHPEEKDFLGEDREWLITYANRKLETEPIDYFVFGHRHLPIEYTLKNGYSRYVNLGEWLFSNSYAVFDGDSVNLAFFENEEGRVFGGG
ncbi:UDP-2,3-diacylglucosamine diphosphatase [Phaeodactylibacter sp.]|uniref:UDP-2,3-diacylglucosamine diphosphatase n=1 Tax=Phaeodactylibacter sp. TaxID=1940289 RepID=UPI0025E2D31C|nr:UDP-2,3-diacylglucosamine diphosphatase [Phaeodactylibacter sp.]MCI4649371.1 UDP-2,3-diacylglucosamine diphosphatase [Phaeodactylibacter sp.]MCI5093612.1 UDP-2,3-diacylglucosamine diphosphatase [Phaeodactylibacter sp.]